MKNPIASLFLISFWVFIVYLIHIFRRRSNRISDSIQKTIGLSPSERIGKTGEYMVSSVLSEYCRRSGSHYFDNVTLPFDGGTTQIDHILVTKKGILVIETKNWSGSIFGKVEDATWTQILPTSKNIYQNPIRQNYKHYLAICQLLNFIPQHCIQEVVVFTGKAVFKTDVPDGILFIDEMQYFLEFIDFGRISDDDIHRAVGRIECSMFERSEQTDRIHQEYLNRTFGHSPIYMDQEYLHQRRKYRK